MTVHTLAVGGWRLANAASDIAITKAPSRTLGNFPAASTAHHYQKDQNENFRDLLNLIDHCGSPPEESGGDCPGGLKNSPIGTES